MLPAELLWWSAVGNEPCLNHEEGWRNATCGKRHFGAWNSESNMVTSEGSAFANNSESLSTLCWVSIDINLALFIIIYFPCPRTRKGKKAVWWVHSIDLDGMRFNWVVVHVLEGKVMAGKSLLWLTWLVDHLYLILTYWGFKIQILGLQDLLSRNLWGVVRTLNVLSPPSFSLCMLMYEKCWQMVSRGCFLEARYGNWAWYWKMERSREGFLGGRRARHKGGKAWKQDALCGWWEKQYRWNKCYQLGSTEKTEKSLRYGSENLAILSFFSICWMI